MTSAVSMLLVAVGASLAVFHPACVRADDLPRDVTTIERLTPEQARTLATRRNLEFLQLDGLKALDADTARVLAESAARSLSCNGLPAIDAHTATALAGFAGTGLALDGLTRLDAETAAALAKFNGGDENTTATLSLNGLTRLDAETAAALARYRGALLLGGLKSLDAATATALAGLESLDADTAAALASLRSESISLQGLGRLDADAAGALAACAGQWLILGRDMPLDAATIRALSTFAGHLSLGSLTTLDADTLEALAAFRGKCLSLDGVRTLEVDTARAVAKFSCDSLRLHGMAKLDPAAITALAAFRGSGGMDINSAIRTEFTRRTPFGLDSALSYALLCQGCLDMVTAFESPDSVAVAETLATYPGPLALPNLQKISPKTLMTLLVKEDVEIPPVETLELILEPDGSLTEDLVLPDHVLSRQRP